MTSTADHVPPPVTGLPPAPVTSVDVITAARRSGLQVLGDLGATADGLDPADAERRAGTVGANTVPQRAVRLTSVIAGQLRSPLLLLLLVTAVASAVLGERTNAAIIVVILVASTGLGTVNEFRAARTARALAAHGRQRATTLRGGGWVSIDVTGLVPGDIVRVTLGTVVPADIRLLTAEALTCDESVLTGEGLAVGKGTDAVTRAAALSDLSCCALMGTVVRSGQGSGVVVATGADTEFGRIARDLQGKPPETSFEAGLRRFSALLAGIALLVSSAVLVINLLLGRGWLNALLFAAAIAVGITPQLLPAVVSTSLAHGSRELARRKVIVKHLVAIEDLGDIDTLVTDKTGTLTTGRFRLTTSVDRDGGAATRPRTLALIASELDFDSERRPVGDPLDIALWQSVPDALDVLSSVQRLDALPFDHDRRRVSVLVREADGATVVVTKGAPESVLAACVGVTASDRDLVTRVSAGGGRIIAVAARPAPGSTSLVAADENGLHLAGLLVFDDPPKPGVQDALARLAALNIRVLMASGDGVAAAAGLARDVGLGPVDARPLAGPDLDTLDDDDLAAALSTTSVLARVSPEHKARVVRVLRAQGRAVGFLGDGVNDALALHDADVGVSVDTAADVAREAADVVLLEKSLAVVADGVTEGRRIFANTVKYVLMGTSSNFGNILSAAAASALLPFLPLLPSQLLLNNLLYDTSQLAIPTDQVDGERLRRPGQWDVGVIRRFMLLFGPLSSLFDFVTFGILLGPFHAGPTLFRSGWFVESLATQTLVVFAIRTNRVPFLRSRPSRPLVISTLAVVAAAGYLPLSPLAGELGFVAPSIALFAAIAALTVAYLALVDTVKNSVFSAVDRAPAVDPHRRTLHRRAVRFHAVRRRRAHTDPSSEGRPR